MRDSCQDFSHYFSCRQDRFWGEFSYTNNFGTQICALIPFPKCSLANHRLQKLHAYFDTFVVKSRNEAHTRVGGVKVDISQENAHAENSTADQPPSQGSSEIVVEENSVQDLLSKFKNQETGPVLPNQPVTEKKNEIPQEDVSVEKPSEPEIINMPAQRKAWNSSYYWP